MVGSGAVGVEGVVMGTDVRGRTRRLALLTAVVALVMVGLPIVAGHGPSAGAVEKLTVCHLGDDGTYRALDVSERALEAHLGHGDSLPDDPIPAAGVITVADSGQLDYEASPRFTLAVTATDLAGMTDTATVTIDLNDVAPAPVTVLGPFAVSSLEAEALEAEFAALVPNEVEVIYDGYSDPADLDARVSGANPPDLILVPQPGTIAQLATDLIDLVTVDGAVLGAPVKADLQSPVWYQPDVFASKGYQVPETFAELVALSDQMVADGEAPWCNYIESGPATGWMGTNWVEDLVLGAEGPAVDDDWVDHDVVFADPRIEAAFERFQQMIDTPGYVFDRANMLNLIFLYNAIPLGDEDCLMHKQASLFLAALDFFEYDRADFSTFAFPAVDQDFGDAATGAGVYVAAVNDSEPVREVTRFMVSDRPAAPAVVRPRVARVA